MEAYNENKDTDNAMLSLDDAKRMIRGFFKRSDSEEQTEEDNPLTSPQGADKLENHNLSGSIHIVFDKHNKTIEHVEELSKKMEEVDVVFVEVTEKRFLWLNLKRVLNDIAQGKKTAGQARENSFLLRMYLEDDEMPSHAQYSFTALMLSLYGAYKSTGKKREVIMEIHKNKKVIKREYNAFKDLNQIDINFINAVDLKGAVAAIKKAYGGVAAPTVDRDKAYMEIIKESFKKKNGQKALIIRGAHHTGVYVELKKGFPNIKATRDFLGESNFIYTLESSIIRKLIFQKYGILNESPISDLEYLQGFAAGLLEISAIILKEKGTVDDTSTINKIVKNINSMDLMKKWFDGLKSAFIADLRKKQKREGHLYFFINWLLSEEITTKEELAKALGIRLDQMEELAKSSHIVLQEIKGSVSGLDS